MESEKVKEIKKALECWQESVMLSTDENYVSHRVTNREILDYINELESENERLKIVVDIANERTYRKKFIDEWRKANQKVLDKQGNGHIAGYPDFDLVYKLFFEQKYRIAELENKNAKLLDSVETVQSNRCVYNCVLTKEHLTKFAEMLKEKLFDLGNIVNENDIDETLKEFINGKE